MANTKSKRATKKPVSVNPDAQYTRFFYSVRPITDDDLLPRSPQRGMVTNEERGIYKREWAVVAATNPEGARGTVITSRVTRQEAEAVAAEHNLVEEVRIAPKTKKAVETEPEVKIDDPELNAEPALDFEEPAEESLADIPEEVLLADPEL